MGNVRQTIIIRTDLALSPGLLAAQVAHLHFEAIRKDLLISRTCGKGVMKISISESGLPAIYDWIKAPYVFVHGVPNIELLEYYEREARNKDVKVSTWKDTIFLEHGGRKFVFDDVKVGIVLGPDDSDRIKSVVSDLPLL